MREEEENELLADPFADADEDDSNMMVVGTVGDDDEFSDAQFQSDEASGSQYSDSSEDNGDGPWPGNELEEGGSAASERVPLDFYLQ